MAALFTNSLSFEGLKQAGNRGNPDTGAGFS